MLESIFILLTFVIFALAFDRIHLGSIAGLLIAGAVIGPHGLSIIKHVDTIEILAELGVSFLLFNIGIELKFERLRLYGWRTYLLALSQLLATAAIFAAFGPLFGLNPVGSAIAGVALALSSTALVLKALADRGRTLTQLGRLAIAILLVQDLSVGPILIVVTALAAGPGAVASTGLVVFYAFVVATVIITTGRFLLPGVLRYVSTHGAQEAFFATILVVVLASGWGMSMVGFSAAIGAFLAGLAIAETPYRHQVAADIAPFRGLLLGIFFIAVGAELDLELISGKAGLIILLTAGFVVAKAVILACLAYVFRYPLRLAIEVGLLLSQGSEFAFIIFPIAMAAGLLPATTGVILMAAVSLSLLLVAALVGTAGRLLDRIEGAALASPEELSRDLQQKSNHVLVVGFGQVGMALTRHLISIGIPVIVIDYNSIRVRESRQRGLPVYYGNALRADVLRSCGIVSAPMVIVTVPDADVTRRIIELVRRISPRQMVIARAPTADSIANIQHAGANIVVEESLTTALELAERVAIMYVAIPSNNPIKPNAERQ